MDKKYITLFKDMAQALATSAETVADYNREKKDETGERTALTMRDDYQELAGRITDEYIPTKNDCAKLMVAAMVLVNQIQDKINAYKKAMTGYQTDIIPKLQDIIDNATDDNIVELINEKFKIQEN